MARVPQDASLDTQVAIKELNAEIRALRDELARAKTQIPLPNDVEKLKGEVIRLSKTPTYLDPNDVFRASGPAHMHGYVPDPGPVAGTGLFLREDATWQPASGGTPGPHTHHDSEVTHTPEGYVSGVTVEQAIDELDGEKLARSGAQDMLGDLDMGGNAIGDVEDLFFTGDVNHAIIDQVRTIYMTGDGEITGAKTIDMSVSGVGEGIIDEVRHIDMNGIGLIEDIRTADFNGSGVGEGIINKPRVIHMDGDHVNDEAKIDGLERVVFNDEPTASSIEKPSRIEFNKNVDAGTDYTAEEAITSWDKKEDDLVAYVKSGSEIIPIALGWDVLICSVGGIPV